MVLFITTYATLHYFNADLYTALRITRPLSFDPSPDKMVVGKRDLSVMLSTRRATAPAKFVRNVPGAKSRGLI